MKITMREIARMAGVTKTTVSLALNDSPQVSEKTKKRIRALADELEYRPHYIARSLATNRTFTIGFIVPSITSSLVSDILSGVNQVAREHNLHVILADSENNLKTEAEEIELLLDRRCDGIILWPIQIHDNDNRKMVSSLVDSHCPLVVIDRTYPYITANYVLLDGEYGGYAATKHLLELGHRRIGILAESWNTGSLVRLEGYLKALTEYSITKDELLIRETSLFQETAGYEETEYFLQLPDRPTAIFCTNDNLAVGMLKRLQDTKMKVPEDMAIVGFDDIRIASYVSVPLTTVSHAQFETGQKATERLLKLIENPATPPKTIILKPKLIVRESTVGSKMKMPKIKQKRHMDYQKNKV